MATPEDLALLFHNIKLEDAPPQHLLKIKFLVSGLLPCGTAPLLRPPSNAITRQAPPADQRRVGIFQSGRVIQIPGLAGAIPPGEKPDGLISLNAAFETLACGPGKSCLEAVEFYDAELETAMLRLSLQVVLKQKGGYEHVFDFELSRHEWKQLRANRAREWVVALDELLVISSDRTYYHVRKRLVCDFGEELALEEEALWSTRWGGTWLREAERAATTVDDINKLMGNIGLR